MGFPDLETRTKVNRLIFYVRVLRYTEVLSWRRSFDHFYRLVERLTKRQLSTSNVPCFYKEIRLAVIEANFVKIGDFCWLFGKKIALKAVNSKWIYKQWISQKYQSCMVDRNDFWSEHLGIEAPYIKRSWTWSKAKYIDGQARDLHYRLRHHSIFTNNRVSQFTGGPSTCTLCSAHGLSVREDNVHLFVFCSRAYELYAMLAPTLKRIASINEISLSDLILGRKIDNKHAQTAFNFIVQHGQLAVWQSRRNLEMNRGGTVAIDLFKKNIFRNLCRVRFFLKLPRFFAIFENIVEPNESLLGFRLREL